MDISEDAKFIISGADDKAIKIFDVAQKKLLHTFDSAHEGKYECQEFMYSLILFCMPDFVYAVKISNDKSYIVSGSGDKSIKVFSITDKKLVHHFINAHEGK